MSQSPGIVLRTLRELTGLSATEVADRANVPLAYLIRVESGEATASDAWLGFVASVLSDALIEKSADTAQPPAAGSTPGASPQE